MKKLVTRIFVEFYQWQLYHWGEDNLPAFTSLCYLGILQSLNVISILMILQNIISIDIFGFLVKRSWIAITMQIGILIANYLIVKPIKATVKEPVIGSKKIAWVYVLLTLFVLAGCIAWVVYDNENK